MSKKFKWKKVLSTALIVGAIGATLVGCSSTDKGSDTKNKDAIKLSYAFFAPANTFPGVQMEKFKEEVEKRTDGKVELELYPGGTLLQADNMYQGVRDGVVDIGLSSPTYETGKYPLMDISDLPSGIPSGYVASKVNYDLVNEFEHEGLKGLQVVTMFAGEPANILTKDKVESKEDLKGMQLRIAGANQDVLKSLGAAPVGMSQTEVPEALQTGIIKGNVGSKEVLKDLQLAEDLKYVVDYPLSVTTFMAVMNEDKFKSLPEDVQKVILEVGEEMVGFTGNYLDDHVKEVMDWSHNEKGVTTTKLSDKEKAEWDEIFKKMQENKVEELDKKGLDAKKYFERLYELIEEHSNK